MRKWAYEAIGGLVGLGIPADRLFSSGAVGEEQPGISPQRPFAVIRFAVDGAGLQPSYPVHQRRFGIWVHDEPGTMENIDSAVKVLKEQLPLQAPVLHEGTRIMDCLWEATSEDFYDDHFRTNVVRVDFLVTYKPPSP